MTHSELLTRVTDRFVELNSINYGPETAPDKVQRYDEEVNRLNALRRKLSREIIDINTDEFQEHTASLQKINDDLQKTISDVTKIAETMDNLVKFVAAVEKIVSIASSVASSSITPFALAVETAGVMKAKADRRSIKANKFSVAESSSPAEEQAFILPTEEVLYGIELTEDDLIITVISGGCTGEGSFHVHVAKGFAGHQPYMVTVYRIVPDDCKRTPELIKVSYSREELGLDGTVEFILRNRIGNTSQHRLDS